MHLLARMTWTAYESSTFLVGALLVPALLAFAASRIAAEKQTTKPWLAAVLTVVFFFFGCGIGAIIYLVHLSRGNKAD